MTKHELIIRLKDLKKRYEDTTTLDCWRFDFLTKSIRYISEYNGQYVSLYESLYKDIYRKNYNTLASVQAKIIVDNIIKNHI